MIRCYTCSCIQTYAVNATPDPSVDSSATLSSADSHLSVFDGITAMSYVSVSSEAINDKPTKNNAKQVPAEKRNPGNGKNVVPADRPRTFNTISENVDNNNYQHRTVYNAEDFSSKGHSSPIV